MPVLFVVAGISTRYSLQKRSNLQYIKERFQKLFVPLIFGILLLVPIQTYFAERFHNNYTGNYLNQIVLFFTKITDFTGYSGGFTPGQLWFVCYLFIISLIALPLFNIIRKREIHWRGPDFLVIALCVITFMLSYIFDISGKSLGEYFSLFFLGYFVLAEEDVQKYIDKYRIFFTVIGIGLTACTVAFQTLLRADNISRGIMILASWIDVLAILGLGRHYLNFQNDLTKYLSKSSFSCYLFHQSWIILIGFYILKCDLPAAAQYIFILAGSFIASTLSYEVCKRFNLFRFMFAIKNDVSGVSQKEMKQIKCSC